MTHRTTSLVAAACASALAALTVVTAAPVLAAERTFADAADDVDHGVDVESVKLVHERNVRVVVQHENLVRAPQSGAGMTVWLDVDRSSKGPEFAFVGGLFEGTDYTLVHTDRWKLGEPVEAPANCRYRMRLDYADDISRIRMSRACLGRPDDVRVAVRAGGQQEDGDQVTDWLSSRRHLTAWVARG